MDPIGASASIISIVQLVGTIVDYANKVRHGSKDRRLLAIECANMQAMLINLNFRFEDCDPQGPWYRAVEPIVVKGGVIDQFATLLLKLQDRLQERRGFGKVAMQTLLWPFDKAEMLDILATIERLKSLINTALSSENFSLSSEIREEVGLVRHGVESLLAANGVSQNKQKIERQQYIYTRLQVVDNESKQLRVSEERCQATGSWLADTIEMRAFLKADRATLCIFGKSGCGKSTLASAFIDEALSNMRTECHLVAYHYCSLQDAKSQTLEAAVGSLIYQICEQSEGAMSFVNDIFTAQGADAVMRRERIAITFENILDQLLRRCPQSLLVIDAIDECKQKNRLIELLQKIQNIDHVKIFATSRPEPDVVRAMTSLPYSLIIDVKPHHIEPDVRYFVQSSVTQNKKWKFFDSALKDLIINTLSDEANGMFRWVRCQMDELRKVRSKNAIKEALRKLPRDLEETYDRQISSLETADRNILCKALIWLSFSERPLNLQELAEVLVLGPNFETIEPDDRFIDPIEILDLSQGLIVDLRAGGHMASTFPRMYRIAKKEIYVGLAHQSVRDFLFSERGLQHFAIHAANVNLAHLYLSRMCLSYLLITDFETGPCQDANALNVRLSEYPFLEYAAFYWAHHLRKAQNPDDVLLDLTMKFMELPKSAKFMSWVQTIVYRKGLPGTAILYSKNSTPLYYAASFGLGRVVSELLKRGANVNERGGTYGGTPLTAAVFRKHADIARLLLQAGADPNIGDLRATKSEVRRLMKILDVEIPTKSRSELAEVNAEVT